MSAQWCHSQKITTEGTEWCHPSTSKPRWQKPVHTRWLHPKKTNTYREERTGLKIAGMGKYHLHEKLSTSFYKHKELIWRQTFLVLLWRCMVGILENNGSSIKTVLIYRITKSLKREILFLGELFPKINTMRCYPDVLNVCMFGYGCLNQIRTSLARQDQEKCSRRTYVRTFILTAIVQIIIIFLQLLCGKVSAVDVLFFPF